MKLVVGLGNPGRQYTRTRHNIGFLAVDAIAEFFHIAVRQRAHDAVVGFGNIGDAAVGLCKPQTFMNRSGGPVVALCTAKAVASADLLVIHDELDCAFGQLKFARGRGAAGHRGVTSLTEALGTVRFDRLRVGIGRPPEGMDPSDYVLSSFAAEEAERLPALLQRILDAVTAYVTKGMDWAMTYHHRGKEAG